MIEKLVTRTKTLTAIQYDGTEDRLLAIASIFGTVEPEQIEEGDWVIGVPGEKVSIVSDKEKIANFTQLNTNPISGLMEGFELASNPFFQQTKPVGIINDSLVQRVRDSIMETGEEMTSTMSIKNEAGETISFETTTITEEYPFHSSLIQPERRPKIGENEEE